MMNDFCNKEQNIYDPKNGFVNPDGECAELYTKDLLKTQKILIVMLWDNTLYPNDENKFIHPEYITKPSKPGIGCIATAIDHYGISLEIVRNYEDAIHELTKQTNPGYCNYYATWVFCGTPLKILPEKNQDPNLIGQFIEVLIQFWKKGGSIVFWCDREPFFYQANLFLQKVEFEDEIDCPSKKTLLRIEGEHQGGASLHGDESSILENLQTFNRSIQFQRPKLSHNIGKLFEGKNHSFAQYNLEFIKPFKPFSRDSEGGISSLFYSSNLMTGTGDIIIDCCLSKCFNNFDEDGIFRYIQNIAGWTARPEIHLNFDNIDPKEWRPKAIEYTIQRNVSWSGFYSQIVDPREIRTLWAIDASESVSDNDFYLNQLTKILNEFRKPDDIFYLWSNNFKQVTFDELNKFIKDRKGYYDTKSSMIAEIARVSNFKEHLIIVTDGSVIQKEIDKSDELVKKYDINFLYVTVFIINNGFPTYLEEDLKIINIPAPILESYKIKPDLTVCCPYCRRCPSVIYNIKGENEKESLFDLCSLELNIYRDIDNICTFQKFVGNYDQLLDALKKVMTISTTYNSDIESTIDDLGKMIDSLYLRVMRSISSSEEEEYFENLFNNLLQVIYDKAFLKMKIFTVRIKSG